MIQRFINKLMLFLMEMTLGYVIFLPFYDHHWQLVSPLAIIATLALFTALIVLNFFQKRALIIYYSTLVIIALISIYVGMHAIFTFVFVLYVGWRILGVANNDTLIHSWSIFYITALVSAIYYTFLQIGHAYFPHTPSILLFILAQLLITLLANSFSEKGHSVQKYSVTLTAFIVITIGTLFIGIMLQFFIPYIKTVIGMIFGYAGLVLVYILMPILQHLQFKNKQGTKELGQFINSMKHPQSNIPKLIPNHHSEMVIWLISAIIFIGIISIVAYKLIRNKQMMLSFDDHLTVPVDKKTLSKSSLPHRHNLHGKPSKQQRVRYLLFQFQRRMKKLGFGRYRKETIEEWFERLPVDSNNQVVPLYEKNRYGEQPLTPQELHVYEEQISRLTEEIRHISKKK